MTWWTTWALAFVIGRNASSHSSMCVPTLMSTSLSASPASSLSLSLSFCYSADSYNVFLENSPKMPGTWCDACDQVNYQYVNVYYLLSVNLSCKENYDKDVKPITILQATETRNLCKFFMHQTTLRTKNISGKQRWIQQNSRQQSERFNILCQGQFV